MKYITLMLALCSTLSVFAQEENLWETSSESKAYHDYRVKSTTPPYGLPKVKKLVTAITSGDDEQMTMNTRDYSALSLREKFTYHMIHAEDYSQNCDAMPPIQDEQKKIFGHLPDAFDEYSWSERQRNFLSSNRDSVIALIRESAARSKRIGVNYKMAIVEINGREMIPFLIKTYKTDPKDHDLLTVLMLLMKNNEYQPFMASASYRKLYGEQADYQASLELNKANEELILKRAGDFYQAFKNR